MFWSIFLIAFPLVYAARLPTPHDHAHPVQKRLPSSWHQPDDHPVHALFRRGTPTDGETFPTVGSPTWSAAFPTFSPDVTQLPQEWVDALNDAVSAGNIPDIPQSYQTAPGTNPLYPDGLDPNGPEVCSATYKCVIEGDIWNAPDGYFASAFDDGPTTASPTLLQFFESNNLTTTHFMIGVYILENPQLFLDIFNAGHDIAVHTWTHPYMTTLSNLEVVAQLGWASEMIRNSTGGRVPRYWRPPYGDSDTRVRAIAQEVFGLETIIWNHDTEDWSLTTNGTTAAIIHDDFVEWLAGSKSPGLITLEHELSDQSVAAFIDNYPLIGPAGWQFGSLLSIIGDSAYQNSDDSESPVTYDGILANSSATVSSSSTAAVAGQTTSTQAPAGSSVSASSTKTVLSTSTVSTTASTTALSSKTSNAASSISPRGIWGISASFSLCVPALLAALAILA